jgi:hypothetical protein
MFYCCFTRLVAGLQMVREIGDDCYCCFTRRWRAYKWCVKRVAFSIVVSPAWRRAYKWCVKGEAFSIIVLPAFGGLEVSRCILSLLPHAM